MKYAMVLISVFAATSATAQAVSLQEASRFTQEFRQKNPLAYEVFAKEIQDGLTADALRCQSGKALPCEDGEAALTPQGIAVGLAVGNEMYPLPASAAPDQGVFNRMVSPGPRSDEEVRKELSQQE